MKKSAGHEKRRMLAKVLALILCLSQSLQVFAAETVPEDIGTDEKETVYDEAADAENAPYEESAGDEGYPVDTTLGITLTDPVMTGESYRGSFSAQVEMGQNTSTPDGNLYFIFSASQNAEIFKGKNVVTKDEIEEAAPAVELSEFCRKSLVEGKYEDYLVRKGDIEQIEDVYLSRPLLPETTYHYRAVYNPYNESGKYYFLTDMKTFTTAAPVTSTSIGMQNVQSVSMDTGYFTGELKFGLTDPQNEWIVGIESVSVDGSVEKHFEMHEPDGIDMGVTGYRCDFPVYGNNYHFAVNALVYTGNEPQLTRVKLVDFGMPAKFFDPQTNISSHVDTAKAGTLRSEISFDPWYALDGLFTYNLFYRKKGNGVYRKINNHDSGKIDQISKKVWVEATWLDSDTEYEYYCELQDYYGNMISSFGTAVSPNTIRTKDGNSELTAADFPDDSLLSYLKKTCSGNDRRLTLSDIEGLTSLNIRPKQLTDAGIYKPIVSINGVENMTGLQTLRIEGMEIEDVSPVTALTELQDLSLDGNELESLPDLSGLTKLTSLTFDDNHITEVPPLPESLLSKGWDSERWLAGQRAPEKELILADRYFAIGDTRPFIFALRGYNVNRNYTASVSINGKESVKFQDQFKEPVFGFSDLNNDIYKNNISDGTYTAKITVSDDFGQVYTGESSVTFVGDIAGPIEFRTGDTLVRNRDYLAFNMGFPAATDPDDVVTEIVVTDVSGNKVMDKNDFNIYPTTTREDSDNRYEGKLRSNSFARDVTELLITSGEKIGLEGGNYIIKIGYSLSGNQYETSAAFTVKGSESTDPEPEPGPEPGPDPENTEKTYRASFYDHNYQLVEIQEVSEGGFLKKPAKEPEMKGYIFVGWAQGGTLWNFSEPVTSNLNLYAKFVKDSKEAVSENTGSGLDPLAKVEDSTVYLVKGQTYAAGGSGWVVKSGGGITVKKDTGVITAKKQGTYIVSNSENEITVIASAPAFDKNSKNSTIMVGEGKRLAFYICSPHSAYDSKYSVAWSSSDPAVASVYGGYVRGLAKGSTTINAYVGGKKYSTKLKVTDTFRAPGKQKGDGAEFSLNPLQSVTLKYDAKRFTVKKAKWSGEGTDALTEIRNKQGKVTGYKNKVISVTSSGKITAIGEGSTTISGNDGTHAPVIISVNVLNLATNKNVYLEKGKSRSLTFSNVKAGKALWTESSEKKITTVSKKGKVKGVETGSSIVTCSCNGFYFKANVFVEEPEFITDSTLVKNGNKYSMQLGAGDMYNRVVMKNVYQPVTFKSSKPEVAFIDEYGIIYARNVGKTNITANINGRTCKISVEVK